MKTTAYLFTGSTEFLVAAAYWAYKLQDGAGPLLPRYSRVSLLPLS